jgi:hypothetical protein
VGDIMHEAKIPDSDTSSPGMARSRSLTQPSALAHGTATQWLRDVSESSIDVNLATISMDASSL